MLLSGFISDKHGNAVPDVLVEIKDDHFQTLFSTESNEQGCYEIDLPAGKYPFVTAVKDYAVNYLEYWCSNLNLTHETQLNIRIDTLEVYGLNYFKVAGAYPSLTIYFRPMSLSKFLAHTDDIAPDIKTIKATADTEELPVLMVNTVKEHVGDRNMTAYLVQVKEPENYPHWDRLDLEITDCNGNYGAASIYNY